MNRLPLLLATCLWIGSAEARAICLPIVCGPPPPILWTWGSGIPPCTGTLQACIDQAAPRDGVEIATEQPIDESISITKSLTLRAAQGLAPAFAANRSITALFTGTDTSASQFIDIEGLALDEGGIAVTQAARGPLDVHVVRDTLAASSLFDGFAIRVETGGNTGVGKLTFDLSSNQIDFPRGIFVATENGAEMSGHVSGNAITLNAGLEGIIINTGDAKSLSADVIGNRISGSFTNGIVVSESTDMPVDVRILDNLVVGQAGHASDAGAIALFGNNAILTATVVNNTVADGEVGLSAQGNLAGLVANNIVSGNSAGGLLIDGADALTLPNRNNLVFGNFSDFFTAGAGTVFDSPHFVGAGDYHVQLDSPNIDHGDSSAVPADLTTDLDGNPRIQGSRVDIGSYEAAPEASDGLASMAGVFALAALAWARRASSARLAR